MVRTKRLIELVKQLDKLHPQGYRIVGTELSKMPGYANVSIGNKHVKYEISETNGAISLIKG